MIDTVKIVGANGKRHERDFYPTPKECVYSLMQFLNLPKDVKIWEPACGDGAIIRALYDMGYKQVEGSDIQTGEDFLKQPKRGEWIITNPPFMMAEDFIRHAKSIGIPFAYLLKIQYWNSKKRIELFNQIRPRCILPLTWRPDFTGQGNSLMDMMWCVWNDRDAETTIFQPLAKCGARMKEGELNE